MNLNEKFLDFINKHELINDKDKILVAFSGGKDSVFLTTLLLKNNYNIALAHLNHNLRGSESERDMEFCIEFAQKHNLQIFTRSLDVKNFAKRQKLSLEEAGRIARYNFLNEIATDYNFSKIATAHHLDDQIETFFINLFRKKSVFSLKGIQIKIGRIIRPILCFTRDEITKYVIENNLEYIEDSSNFDIKFLRNKIRHSLIPFLSKGFDINLPSIVKFYQERISEIEEILNFIISEFYTNSIIYENNGIKINLKKISDFFQFKIIRFEIYKNILIDLKVNYSERLLEEIDNFILSKSETGRFFKHKLKIFKEYSEIFFTHEFDFTENKELVIPSPGKYNFKDYEITIEIVDNDKIKFSENLEYIDLAKTQFPLKVRFFKNGDRFKPLGFNNEIKLKNFFINNKIPFRIRKNILIFEDACNKIINVGNLRISEDVKIDKNTKKALKFKILLN